MLNSINSTKKKQQMIITKKCTGCGICASICPKKCIKIIKNNINSAKEKGKTLTSKVLPVNKVAKSELNKNALDPVI